MTNITIANLGFPRIGEQRELKKALEDYWQNKITETDLKIAAYKIKMQHWFLQKEQGLDFIPSNDFSFYDHVLDMAVTLGVIPPRYQFLANPLEIYFAMARGKQDSKKGIDLAALEMTKWFDTNYHYIVPELQEKQIFNLNPQKMINDFLDAKSLGIKTRPVIIGPFSFLLLAKFSNSTKSPLTLIESLIPIYEQLLTSLKQVGVEWIQIDEPCLCIEQDAKNIETFAIAYHVLNKLINRPKIMLTTYFESIEEHFSLLADLNFDGIHLDLVRAESQFTKALRVLNKNTLLSLGVIDGRNIWRTDLEKAFSLINKAITEFEITKVCIAPSCSLLHSPINLNWEKQINPILKHWLAFAVQKLQELQMLKQAILAKKTTMLTDANENLKKRQNSTLIRNEKVQTAIKRINSSFFNRSQNYTLRAMSQNNKFHLPIFPTTTIGSFPQTPQIRKARAQWRAGALQESDYQQFLKKEIEVCIRKQEELDLDVLVHGEFERSDMVEYFAEKLDGFAFTINGWVQSYGSRYVKPPIIYGDVYRKTPMTIDWIKYAQSLTSKPLKGMLTGPVTILQWSFVRNDQPRSQTCLQIALALREELLDLEANGIKVIQVDEPALREGLPLRKTNWPHYLSWAVQAFKLATCGVKDDTQIHSHMCYSSFGDILPAIIELDTDVLSIETSRSNMELFHEIENITYPNAMGPGVYDIHSPRIPQKEEIIKLLENATKVLDKKRIWVNPDCGLKTRSWEEVEPALKNMVAAAKEMRKNDS